MQNETYAQQIGGNCIAYVDPGPTCTSQSVRATVKVGTDNLGVGQIALGNFAMVIFEPTQVDWVQLGEHPNRRTLFTRKDEQGGTHWVEEILVP